ncbi:hypothetical protein MKK69_19425 [Methylobacterium sp. J-026]|uniref:hypothetical protein n=1 Tax=Methylobacterium sp. J-026 TaxID=2836624 RepID=UPI001FBC041D|nr:hypothetical protein [Methylobacterium sp. J-026]MCJ2136195.1 hypothetical protein [Methylobacterium sp. J-026]
MKIEFASAAVIIAISTSWIAAAFPATADSLDIYEHNGSVIHWSVLGDAIKATYSTPRPGLAAAGISPGAILFEGTYKGGQIVGRAYAFKAGCPPAGYDVIGGEVTRGTIVLRGPGPHRASNSCAVLSYLANSPHARLVLTYSATVTRTDPGATSPTTPAPTPVAELPTECKWSKSARLDQSVACPSDNQRAETPPPVQATPAPPIGSTVQNAAPAASNTDQESAFWRAKAAVRDYAARLGETPEQFSARVGDSLTNVEGLVYGVIRVGGDPNSMLRSLEGYTEAMKNPLKRKLRDCLLKDPKYGPVPTLEECTIVERQLGLPPLP